jgi:hypothetical protein
MTTLEEEEEEFEEFRDDLISYLVRKLEVPRADVLARLGNWLMEPVPAERREQYTRENHARKASR